ncbi:hypothetical protein NEICINOT_03509 [Neisseria cinerea ATCC 14685]|uniref:Uncharacterized protein n=1 Tax=Neisseria cinerea ATCC 14685 TaxID=546262 RepID=D0W1I6_NEICI|nr:hypothetical protein NEICINOT_03509 [Neisseria cinerea ATCC 14685]
MGQVFRHNNHVDGLEEIVVIPDLWGKSSDCASSKNRNVFKHLQC